MINFLKDPLRDGGVRGIIAPISQTGKLRLEDWSTEEPQGLTSSRGAAALGAESPQSLGKLGGAVPAGWLGCGVWEQPSRSVSFGCENRNNLVPSWGEGLCHSA